MAFDVCPLHNCTIFDGVCPECKRDFEIDSFAEWLRFAIKKLAKSGKTDPSFKKPKKPKKPKKRRL